MRALIIGAGVCGPATAMALQRAGIEAVVYEAHRPAAGDVGSYLTVATNGLDALRAIDASGPVLQAGFPTNRTVLLSGTGKRLGVVPLGSSDRQRHPSHTIKRAHLHRALHDEATQRGVRIEFGKRLSGAAVTHSGVRAEFEDGSDAVGDLLVGCDGVHSRTRTTIDRGAPAPRYVGLLNFGGYTSGASVGEPGAWHMIFGHKAFFGYVADGAGGTVWFANVPRHHRPHPNGNRRRLNNGSSRSSTSSPMIAEPRLSSSRRVLYNSPLTTPMICPPSQSGTRGR